MGDGKWKTDAIGAVSDGICGSTTAGDDGRPERTVLEDAEGGNPGGQPHRTGSRYGRRQEFMVYVAGVWFGGRGYGGGGTVGCVAKRFAAAVSGERDPIRTWWQSRCGSGAVSIVFVTVE